MALLVMVLVALPLVAARYAVARLDELRDSAFASAVESSHARILAAIDSQQNELSRTLEDWTAWDAMYTFAQDPTDTKWREENFAPDSIATLGLSRIALFDSRGAIVLHSDYDHEAGAAADYGVDESATGLVAGLGGVTDLSMWRGGLSIGPDGRPSLALVKPIRRSDKTGPPKGFLMMVRPLTGELIDRIGLTSGVAVSFLAAADSAALEPADVAVAQGQQVRAMTLTAWDGRRIGCLRVQTPVTAETANDQLLRGYLLRGGIIAYLILAGSGLIAFSTVWSRRDLPRATAQRTGRWPVLLTGLCGLAMTGIATWTAYHWQLDVHRREFGRRAGNYVEQIDRALAMRRSALVFARSHFHSSIGVSADEFERLTLNAGLMLPGTRVWAWIPRLPGDSLAAGGRAPITERDPLIVLPSSSEDEFRTLLSAWPGFDGSVGAAMDSGETVAVTLPDNPIVSPHARTVAMMTPVYGTAVDPLLEHRRRDFRGVLVSVVELDVVIRDAVQDIDHGGLLARITGVCHRATLPAPVVEDNGGGLVRRSSTSIAGSLSLDSEIDVTERFSVGLEKALLSGVSVGGTAVTMLLCAFIEINLRRTRRVEQLVAQRTRELEDRSRELISANTAAQEAHQAKSVFLANMSHELRTPMTAILGYSDLLFETQHTAEARKEFIHTIRRSGEHLLALINDVLDLSKIEAGRLTVEKLPCATPALIADVISLLREKAVQKGIGLWAECAGPIPATIVTDPTRFRQILVNLVGNAVKFTDSGGVRILVRPPVDDTDPDPVMSIEVIDSGPGIDDVVMSRLFKPFEQGDGSMSRKFGGTGLGLSISLQLAEMLGGRICASSVPGEGSSFVFTFRTGSLDGVERRLLTPYAAGDRAIHMHEAGGSEAQGAAIAEEIGGDRPGCERPETRILLAEDTIDNQRLLCLYLRKFSSDVEVVPNGQEAVAAALRAASEGKPFGVILMDMQMPVMDGYTATRALRRAAYAMPIIALTAHVSSSDRQKCLDAGCDGFLSKPVNRAELARVCGEQIGRSVTIAKAA